jgi:hypothetical protein
LKLIFLAVANSNESIYHPLTQCADGSFCCGSENTTCCLASQGYYLDQSGKILAVPSATITAYTTATATSVVSTTNTSNKGAVIGLASALGVVSFVSLIALLFAIWRFRRSKSNGYKNGDGIYQPHFDAKNPRAELQNTGPSPRQDISEIGGEFHMTGTGGKAHITELPGETSPSKDPMLLGQQNF